MVLGVVRVTQEEPVHVARQPEVDPQPARGARLEHDVRVAATHLVEHVVQAEVVAIQAVARAVPVVGAGAAGVGVDVEVELDPACTDLE